VLNRLASAGVKVYRTDESGTIVATTDGTTITFNAKPSEIKPVSPVEEQPEASVDVVISDLDLENEKVTMIVRRDL